MARIPALHYNPPSTDRKSRCGRKLENVRWTTDPNDATCNTCRRLISRVQRVFTK